MPGFTIVTNNVPREVIEGGIGMSADERADFDYIDWDAVASGSSSAAAGGSSSPGSDANTRSCERAFPERVFARTDVRVEANTRSPAGEGPP